MMVKKQPSVQVCRYGSESCCAAYRRCSAHLGKEGRRVARGNTSSEGKRSRTYRHTWMNDMGEREPGGLGGAQCHCARVQVRRADVG